MKLKKEAVLFSLIVVPILLYILFLYFPEDTPTTFVTNRTVETRSNFLYNYEIIKYPTAVEIINVNVEEKAKIGIVTDPWNLNFGIIPGNGSSVKRQINVNNLKSGAAKIMLRVYGNIKPFVVFSKNDFILKKDESQSIDVIFISGNSTRGNYTGEVQIIIQRSKI